MALTPALIDASPLHTIAFFNRWRDDNGTFPTVMGSLDALYGADPRNRETLASLRNKLSAQTPYWCPADISACEQACVEALSSLECGSMAKATTSKGCSSKPDHTPIWLQELEDAEPVQWKLHLLANDTTTHIRFPFKLGRAQLGDGFVFVSREQATLELDRTLGVSLVSTGANPTGVMHADSKKVKLLHKGDSTLLGDGALIILAPRRAPESSLKLIKVSPSPLLERVVTMNHPLKRGKDDAASGNSPAESKKPTRAPSLVVHGASATDALVAASAAIHKKVT